MEIEKFRFTAGEVYIQRLGDAAILTPKNFSWATFMNGLSGFTDDFMTGGREPETPTKRETL